MNSIAFFDLGGNKRVELIFICQSLNNFINIKVDISSFTMNYIVETTNNDLMKFITFIKNIPVFEIKSHSFIFDNGRFSIILDIDIYGHVNYEFYIQEKKSDSYASFCFTSDQTFLNQLISNIEKLQPSEYYGVIESGFDNSLNLSLSCNGKEASIFMKTSFVSYVSNILLYPELKEYTKLLEDYKSFTYMGKNTLSFSPVGSLQSFTIDNNVALFIADIIDSSQQNRVYIERVIKNMNITAKKDSSGTFSVHVYQSGTLK